MLYVPFSCGGCLGRRVSRLAAHLRSGLSKEAGIQPTEIAVHLSACVVNESGHYPPCPHLDYVKTILSRKGLRAVEGAYLSASTEERPRQGYYTRFSQKE